MGGSAVSLATVLRCQSFLEVNLGWLLAAKNAGNGGLELLRNLALNAPSACRVLDQIRHHMHRKATSVATSRGQTKPVFLRCS